MFWLLRFVIGWVTYIIVFLYSIIFSLILWNWEETFTIDMEVIITEILGKSVLNTMMFRND
jgi:hypothetical protein